MPDNKDLGIKEATEDNNKNMRMLTPEDLGVKTEDISDKYNKEKESIMKDVVPNDLQVGIEIEKEHLPTVNKIKEYFEKKGALPPNELIYEWISLDHISEYKNYYNDKNGLPAMERKLSEETFHDREHNEASVTAKKVKDEDTLIERLAELEHEQWMEWSKDISKKEKLSSDRLKRWKEYWADYDKLKEDVKEQDRKYARKVLKIFKEKINNEIKASDIKLEANKMTLKDVNINGKVYKGLSDGKNIYFNDIDAQELGMNTMEIKAEVKEIEENNVEQFKSITCPECGTELQEKTCECGWNLDKEYEDFYDNKGEGE